MVSYARLIEVLEYDPATGRFTWLVKRGRCAAGTFAGQVAPNGYRMIRVDGRLYLAHRLAFLVMTGEWPVREVDHKNRVRDDNRWKNLRLASGTENKGNTSLRSDNTSGMRGVYWCKRRKRWVAQIKDGDKNRYIGAFTDLEGAKAAYQTTARAYFGEFTVNL